MSGHETIAAAGRWAAFLAYLGLTVFLSHQTQIPGVSDIPDYCLHVPEFALLTVLLLTALSGSIRGPHARHALWSALAFGAGYGVIDEFHQWFVPGRQSSVKDAAVDAGATALTVLLAAIFGRRAPAPLPEHGDAREGGTGHGAAEAGSKGALGAFPIGGDRERAAGERGPDGAIRREARVELLTREGCHLCEEARGVLTGVLGGAGAGWTEIDVDEDPRLASLYGLEIPVVLIDGIKRFKGKVDRERLVGLLEGADRLRRGGLTRSGPDAAGRWRS